MSDLTPEEEERLRLLLSLNRRTIERLERVAQQDERMEWMWAALRRAASTLAVILGAIILLFDQIKAFIRSLVQ